MVKANHALSNFALGFNVSIKSTKIPLSSFGQRIYVTRINSNCCYTHNHISRKVPMSTRCIRDLSRGGWRVLQLTYFVCEQSNLTLQLQHLSVRLIATRSVRCTVFWRRRNSARRSNRTASWGESGRRIFVHIQTIKGASRLPLSISGRRMS